ncbi:DNA modification methyltransferase related protein [Leptolyngbya sp. NIES-3755]|nr:DNA modification methyltransferase related protein [Leptolyngbya sp. NIES-3755]
MPNCSRFLLEMMTSVAKLHEFVSFSKTHLKGNERKEAQSFLNAFFQAFGYENAIAAGAEFEQGVAKGSAKGNKGAADLVWSHRLLVEMKSRGENLANHYSQLERYWMRLTPKPQYSILCNFDEFWIYDFHNQVDTPVDVIKLDELVHRSSAFNFMGKANHTPIFRNNQVEITERNARLIGELYQTLLKRGKQQGFSEFNEEAIQRFILQCVLAMFAEDRELLPKDLFVSCVQDCIDQKGNSYDILGGLFQAMNQKGVTPQGRYKGVEYFNGGLFAEICPIALEAHELELLQHCASQRWDQVRPSIFGSIFTSAIDAKYRHAHGMHYTSEADIRQIVIPTISEDWEAQIEGANTLKQIQALHRKLQTYRVLDPACGSGNFLYVAYQELKRVEKRLLDRTSEMGGSTQLQIGGLVSPNQFFGMDTNLFAVQLARVTMMIARKIAIDTFKLTESALPLDTLDHNIVCQDALFSEWTKADAIIGNPPFLGGKKIKSELGQDYAEKLYKQFPDVKGQPDYCVFWFRKAADLIDENGRVGFVGTNSIAQNTSRVASLDYVVEKGGQIHNAISTQPWSGEANVHVSMVNWARKSPQKYVLDKAEVDFISTSLKCELSVISAFQLGANKQISFQACELGSKGFIVSETQAKCWISQDLKNVQVLKPMVDGRSLVNPLEPLDWVVDFADMDIEEASEYTLPFLWIKQKVKPEREHNSSKSVRENWWRFRRISPVLRQKISGLSCYFATPKVSKYVIFQPVSTTNLPCEANMVIASEDFYVLGILTSIVHRTWVKAQSSTLEDRTRYTNTTCFETFPFPQTVTRSLIQEIRGTMQDLHEYRSDLMNRRGWGITKLYNDYFHEPSSRLCKLHQLLDKLVLQAYQFTPNDQLLDRLLTLNLELAEKEKNGEPVIGASAPVGDQSREMCDRILIKTRS